MMIGIDVETTVPESTATNMPMMRPDSAVSTSRCERLASSEGVSVVAVTSGSAPRMLIEVNYI